jgi:alkanesulfonate monooxygenase SsuD/methylene tetrahydromethanopterin reductase-like flavin-dependent oxidoreductase (luciferase family)
MNVGLLLNTEYPAGDDPVRRLAEHREQVRLARDAGFDLVGFPHHYSRGPSFWLPPLVTAAALAGDAGRMQVATTVLLLPMQHPVEIAEQAAMLDVVCGGRFVLGVGSGWQPEEFRALGIPMGDRARRMEESLAIIERLWRGESVTLHGKHFAVEDARLTLTPVQRPRPPIWMGANASPAAVRRAARLADAWIVSSHPDVAAIERHVQAYREALAEYGKPFPAGLPVLRNVYVGRDMASAVAEARPYFEASYEIFGDWGLFEDVLHTGKRQLHGRELFGGRLFIGGAEDCLEQISACAERIPIGCLILRMQWLGLPHVQLARAIALVGERLLPALRRIDPLRPRS